MTTPTPTPNSSGYTSCACRDCFDIAVSDDIRAPDLCWDCKAASCDASGGSECSRPVEISDDCNHCHVSDAPYDEVAGCFLCEGCAREGQGDTDYEDEAAEALKAAEGEKKP